MRKNSPRKWLHACLDLLPVILIPVFMIYSHRHTINDGSLQVQEKIAVDFNQLKENGNVVNLDTYYGLYGSLSNENSILVYTPDGTNTTWYSVGITTYFNNLVTNHKYLTRFDFKANVSTMYLTIEGANGGSNYNKSFTPTNDLETYSIEFDYTRSYNGSCYIHWVSIPVLSTTNTIYLTNINLFDLTQMFGVDNEPTIEQFNEMFPNDYYAYQLSNKFLVTKPSLTTYNDTDIMSQFTYQLYNSVDKYFNMGNVFNMNGVYDWFNLNIFNGSAPIYIYVVWQIVLYEFVMDLLFLLYGLFMWFIDMVQHLMDKPFKSIK